MILSSKEANLLILGQELLPVLLALPVEMLLDSSSSPPSSLQGG